MCPLTFVSCVSLVFLFAKGVAPAKIDLIDCGVDHDDKVSVGEIHIEQYPWLGVLFYTDDDMEEQRAVTPVVLIQESFCLASAADIAMMPKETFRKNTRVLLGEDWSAPGRRVRSYIIHPEYGETYNTLAMIYLRDGVHNGVIKHMCPPPETLQDPEFYVVRFKNDYNNLQKEVIPMYYVPPRLCRDFYVATNLYSVKMRPPHVVCACSMEHESVCVWETGSVLVTRDVWGRWLFLGFGVRGPGCSAPTRFLDMASYYPWVHDTLHRFQPLTISRISQHKYVLRGGVTQGTYGDYGSHILQRFGVCDEEEKKTYTESFDIGRLYRDYIRLRTDNNQMQFLMYNLTITQQMQITCMQLELVNASSSSEMKMRHFCPHAAFGRPCYAYRGSIVDISVYLMFSDTCTFEINIWGAVQEMKLLDMLEWHWEEGTYYEDFTMKKVEYRGLQQFTGFGFEPVDPSQWVPEFDLYTTTEVRFYDTTTENMGEIDAEELIKKAKDETIAEGLAYVPKRIKMDWTKPTPTTTGFFVYIPGFFGAWGVG